ncbi:barstar family protein [Luteimonas huabeiensis]|uniref:barstar family protein n=1 Tax=Luteimonas huabeiensis TaxID=1244513 RepID=UPI000464118E|nr:barstar family protein [Luteimonas huabeiensis]
MSQTLVLDGRRIHDIASFYAEVERVLMAGVDWPLGHSLDALDDLLYGGYGALQGTAPVTLVWADFERNRQALGVEATRRMLEDKLARPGYDVARIRRELDALEAGTGPTFFDIVLEILASHPNIALVAR